MDENKKYIQYYKKLLSNFSSYLTAEEIDNATNKSSEGFSYLTSGYKFDINFLLKNTSYDFDLEGNNEENRSQEIFIKNIKFISLCKHHLLPFFGSCEIIYFPNKKIIGFSRVKKIVKTLSLRIQLQENLTKEISDVLIKILDPRSLKVKIDAIHTCMMIGDDDNGNEITTIENYIKNKQ